MPRTTISFDSFIKILLRQAFQKIMENTNVRSFQKAYPVPVQSVIKYSLNIYRPLCLKYSEKCRIPFLIHSVPFAAIYFNIKTVIHQIHQQQMPGRIL